VRIALEDVTFSRGDFTLACSGVFEEGVHLVTGRVGSGKTTLALLLAGPALSLPNMLVIRTVLGTRKTVTFVSLVVFMAAVSGVLFGMFFPEA